jgi:hypothetical protein
MGKASRIKRLFIWIWRLGTAVVITAGFLKIPLTNLVLLVNQNWLALYIFSIFAFWKTEKSNRRFIVTGLALISCLFLLAGFSWWIIYPVALLTIGYLRYRYNLWVSLKNKAAEELKQ